MVSQLKVNKIIKQSGSSITIGEAGDSITFPSTGTASGIFTNVPAFEAYMSADLSVSGSTDTVITFNTENFDTDSAYDTSSYKFTPQVAGKYFFYTIANVDDGSSGAMCWLGFGKNGTFGNTGIGGSNRRTWATSGNSYIASSAHVTLNGSSDYVQAYVRHENSSSVYASNGSRVWSIFGGYRIIGA